LQVIRFCRACIKLLFLAIWTIGLTSVYLPIFKLLPGRRRKTSWQQFIKHWWGKGCLIILRVNTDYQRVVWSGDKIRRYEGQSQGTWREAQFCVSNHLSYLDIPILLAFNPGRFIAKTEVQHWPVIGLLTRIYGTLFINRERLRSLFEMNSRIEHLFRDNPNECVWLFPEGTTSNGREVLPYMPSLLRIIEKRHPDIPVYNTVLQYRTDDEEPDASNVVCWWGDDEPFAPHAWNMLKLKRVYATILIFEEPFLGGDRKALAQQLQSIAEHGIQKKQDRSPAFETA
jgi:1-acyl-sn-glycerol-3-phosphate acyltransferase